MLLVQEKLSRAMTTGGHVLSAADFPSTSASTSEAEERSIAQRRLVRGAGQSVAKHAGAAVCGAVSTLGRSCTRRPGDSAGAQVVALDTIAERIMSFTYKYTNVSCRCNAAYLDWKKTTVYAAHAAAATTLPCSFGTAATIMLYVQFARSADGGYEQYAIKFFLLSNEVFRRERALYRNHAIKCTLPDLLLASDDTTGAVVTEGGYPFPPFLVRNSHASYCDVRT